MTDPRRQLPSVSALIDSDALRPLLARAPRALVVDAVRAAIDAARRVPGSAPRSDDEWAAAVGEELRQSEQPSLRPVLNATGVVLHTNLGRAPLAAAALAAIQRVGAGYSNLEYDVERGERGSRYAHCVGLLRELTGAEDAVVVNNCAGALVLTLNTLADGRSAVISRGELVEIGGSFRIPDIMAKSGGRLVEVGTTNRTHADDYRRAIGPACGALVKVHRSNFTVEGFVAEVGAAQLAAIAAEHDLPLVHDLGSGLMMSLAEYGLSGEPTAGEAVRSGATVVTMSADKLLGGPQAGVILGRSRAVGAIRTNPLVRSYRVDKLTLAALEATLALYREPQRALREIPVLAMLTASHDAVRERASRICAGLAATRVPVSVVDTNASVGGGAFPAARIPSAAVAVGGPAERIERELRAGETTVIPRVADGQVLLDPRTVSERDDVALMHAVADAIARAHA
ncbi:MAG: L-seryl-tRNA(Sec) selenium transferase [Gemmatimonadaceae bacterium]